MKKRIETTICAALLCVSLCMGCGAAPASKNDISSQNQVNDTENTLVDVTEGTESIFVDTTEGEMVQEETQADGTTETTQDSEYANFAIANVSSYVNVRKGPSTEDSIVGKIYSGAVAQILSTAGDNNDWLQVVSGNVEGYIKAEYFIYGDAAAEVMGQYVTRYAKVNVTRLNVRAEQSTSSKRIGYLNRDEMLEILMDCGEWLRVKYTDDKEGYVASQYISVVEEYRYAKTLEEIRQETEVQREKEKRVGVSEEKVKESTKLDITPPSTTYRTNEELRKAIVDYALQYVGNRYVNGGQSLKSGTDCSGFTMYILREFGYSISRTPQGQYKGAGRSISYSEIQPGDIICYSSNGGRSCTHVAFYIGNGQIVHAANSRDGVKISSATYEDIYGVRNVID